MWPSAQTLISNPLSHCLTLESVLCSFTRSAYPKLNVNGSTLLVYKAEHEHGLTHFSFLIQVKLWTHKATQSPRGKGQADGRKNDLGPWKCGSVNKHIRLLSEHAELHSPPCQVGQSVHLLTCCMRCNYSMQVCCVTHNWCSFSQEGLKSVLIVNLSRPSLSASSSPPP